MMLTVLLALSPSTALLNGLIVLAFGVYSSLVGYRIIPANFSDPKKSSAWMARWGGQARIGGPLLILFGLFLAGRAVF